MISRIFSRQNILLSLAVLYLVSFNAWVQGKDANDSNSVSFGAKTDSNSVAVAAKPLEQSGPEDILKKIPAESLFVLRVNNFDNAIGKVDEFIAGLSPMPMGLRIMIRVQVAGILGNPQLPGVNMDGDFVLFGLPAEGNPVPTIFLLVPVTNYQTLVTENNNLSKEEISAITKDGATKAYCMKFSNHYALVSQTAENLRKVSGFTGGIDSILDAKQIEQSSQSQIWALGNLQLINKAFGAILDSQFEATKSRIQNPPQRVVRTKNTTSKKTTTNGVTTNATSKKVATNNVNANTTARTNSTSKSSTAGTQVNTKRDVNKQIAGIKLYFDAIKRLMSEGKIFTINADFISDVLHVSSNVIAMPGTTLAESFSSSGPEASNDSILKYLKNGSAMDIAMNTKAPVIKEMNDSGNDLFFMDAKVTETDIAKFKDIGKELSDIADKNVAFSLVQDKVLPVGFKYILEIKDPNKANNLASQLVELVKVQSQKNIEINDPNKQGGQSKEWVEATKAISGKSFKVSEEDYNGIKINEIKMGNMSKDPNSPKPQNIDYAIFNNLVVAEYGSEPNVSIKTFIDEVKASNNQVESEFQTAIRMIPDSANADVFGKMNLVRFISIQQSAISFMAKNPVEIPQSCSNMVFALKAENGSLRFDIALPKEHVTETGQIAKLFQLRMGEQRKTIMQMRKQARLKKQADAGKTKWTCSIHQKVNVDQPGLCPVCQRELIPVVDEPINKPTIVQNDTKPAESNGDREKRVTTRATMQKLQMEVMKYKKVNGQLPSDLSGLQVQGQNGEAAEGPKDGWGNAFVYEASPSYARGFIIISNGSDNQPGGQGFAADLSTDPIGLKKKQRAEKMQNEVK